ncbi:hypothetical protein ACFQLX_08955 [Streptomyces polyrhachis]|uniref:ATP/GTP-binding protein n=1 Tax=Streptomyces polyrhachis TaxID=1282885 RepID=A0ABW2GC24_9ACTN
MAMDGRHRSQPPSAGAPQAFGGIPGQRAQVPPHPFVAWLRAPRPAALPGIWRPGHTPRPPQEPGRVPDRQLLGGAALSLLGVLVLWSLYRNGVIPFRYAPLQLLTPDGWWEEGRPHGAVVVRSLYDTVVFALVCWFAGRSGQWREVARRYVERRPQRTRAARTAGAAAVVALLTLSGFLPLLDLLFTLVPPGWLSGGGDRYAAALVSYSLYGLLLAAVAWPFARWGRWRRAWRGAADPVGPRAADAPPAEDPAAWPQLAAAGLGEAAERLAREAHGGAMTDVDQARIARAWEGVRARPARTRAFAEAVAADGAAACPHPSGARELPERRFRHDLPTGQVRIGAAPDGARTPYDYRGAGIALDPVVLATGLVVVGPAASGKTGRVVAPVVETLCLQALAGRAAVIAVGAAGTRLGPDGAYDVVIRLGDPHSPHDLDFYGGTNDPDEAAALLAEALLGEDAVDTGRVRQAATALAQLLGAYGAAHGRFPSVPRLRALLDHEPAAVAELRAALDDVRELDARERQAGRPDDIGPLLADRLAVLDRPAFAGFFDVGGRGRQFSMRALEHPMRVRVELPERAHAQASRLVARLLLAQFTAAMPVREDRSLFAALVLDDAAGTVTAGSIRSIQRLRTAHAGVVLALRSLDEVPEALRGALLAAVGCRMALSGISTWDGRLFAQTWGAEWVETRDVTHTPDTSGGVLRRSLRLLSRLVTGAAATRESVTVRTVERERWSASDLANSLPPGHGVLSLTAAGGERTPPVLVELGDGAV